MLGILEIELLTKLIGIELPTKLTGMELSNELVGIEPPDQLAMVEGGSPLEEIFFNVIKKQVYLYYIFNPFIF